MKTANIIFILALVFSLVTTTLFAEGGFVVDLKIEGDAFVYQGNVYTKMSIDYAGKVLQPKEIKILEFIDDPVIGKILKIVTRNFYYELPVSSLYVFGDLGSKYLYLIPH